MIGRNSQARAKQQPTPGLRRGVEFADQTVLLEDAGRIGEPRGEVESVWIGSGPIGVESDIPQPLFYDRIAVGAVERATNAPVAWL